MGLRTHIAESMVDRTGGLVEAVLASMDHTAEDLGRQKAKSISEYAYRMLHQLGLLYDKQMTELQNLLPRQASPLSDHTLQLNHPA